MALEFEFEKQYSHDPSGYSVWISLRNACQLPELPLHTYVNIYINGDKKVQTKTVDSKCPIWNDMFTFELEHFPRTITFEVKDTNLALPLGILGKDTLELGVEVCRKVNKSTLPIIVHDGKLRLENAPNKDHLHTGFLDALIVVAALSRVPEECLNWDCISSIKRVQEENDEMISGMAFELPSIKHEVDQDVEQQVHNHAERSPRERKLERAGLHEAKRSPFNFHENGRVVEDDSPYPGTFQSIEKEHAKEELDVCY